MTTTTEYDVDIHLTKKTSHPIDPKRNEGAATMARKANAHAHAHSTIKRNPITLVATAGLEAAIERCKSKVAKISAECRARNLRFRDNHFDLDDNNCLYSLNTADDCLYTPAGNKRLWEIFDKPKFFEDDCTAGDIRQGNAGDCWFLAALTTITNIPGLIEKLCVARDEQVGVYGFIFFRDGDWVSTIVDDILYVRAKDYDQADPDVRQLLKDDEDLYRRVFQTGSDALYFSCCKDNNETWLPLLEKAFAKVHGDYEAIDGGLTGYVLAAHTLLPHGHVSVFSHISPSSEAVEDLTGGVTTTMYCKDILDLERFWTEELMQVNRQYLFGVSISKSGGQAPNGLIPGHAYSILRTVEAKGKRFLLIRNPWGKTEWNGKWSDGSAEWTAEWMSALDHRFGDDGVFWMEYPDFLRQWTLIDRTRLFDSSWTVASQWVEFATTWPATWSDTTFQLTVTQRTPAVIVLSQLDTRYYRGFEGPYDFFMELRVHAEGCEDYIARSRGLGHMMRSANVEVNLEPGTYTVYVKVTRTKNGKKSVEEMVVESVRNRPNKFLATGENYMLAKAKGGNSENPLFEKLGLLAKKTYAQSGPPVAPANANAEDDEAEANDGDDDEQWEDADDADDADEAPQQQDEEEGDETDGTDLTLLSQMLALQQAQAAAAAQQTDDTDDSPTVVAGLRVYALDAHLTINARIGGQHVLPDPEDAQGDSKTDGDNPLAHEGMPGIGVLR
ncbi:hypothetical protein HK104_001800, partial [Borealophlyctis nickersoniae]